MNNLQVKETNDVMFWRQITQHLPHQLIYNIINYVYYLFWSRKDNITS